MLIAWIAAAAAALIVIGYLVARQLRARSDRRVEALVKQVDEQLRPISLDLQRAAERSSDLRERGLTDRDLTLDFEALHRDELTGLGDRNAYEAALELEISRARRAGEPLALVLLELEGRTPAGGDGAAEDRVVREFARVLTRVARTRDTVCRRGPREFGVLLPETTADGARRLHSRLRDEVAAAFGTEQPAFSAGLAEWQPDETSDTLDARAGKAVGTAFSERLGSPAAGARGAR
jgi:diguanylate cyclase (GGDEF)-like protein